MFRWIIILLLSFKVYSQEDLESKVNQMVSEHVYSNFSSYEIISILPISKSYIKILEGKEFDSVVCKSKGSSNLYLYLGCSFKHMGVDVASFPVTVRIKEGSKVAIEKNKKVSILYIEKNFRISLLGVALQSGKIGDIIEVKNISTGKVLKGRVISETEVLVEP